MHAVAARPLFAVLVAAVLAVLGSAVQARCTKNVADGGPIRLAGLGERLLAQKPATASAARITFVGHASFLIETPQGVRVITDYNGLNGYGRKPDIVTMNNAHGTHFTDDVEPGVTYVLRGWAEGGKDLMTHEVELRDVKVWNVPTNVRDYGGTRINGNSIFGFQIGDLCIAHLGHLHHRLEKEHLEQLGRIDVLMVPIDGSYTMGVPLVVEVVKQVQPQVVLPMHYWGSSQVERFLRLVADSYEAVWPDSRTIDVTKAGLPEKPAVIVVGGSGGD
ncbi:MBL fold metallo-hydrolase [Vineibacter terrae]|uniref:MBL fold metallo-hydrolase n=1 Tax=Vineibacter terrae TaxID=2586908 RepID=A0A5C8PRF8_9HYPH|nr:MBL fold metallo-hydrolase [Vineibacter terrae]TXL78754.1 MBL fold metallo-hydrolase [Vineibacter terrae]